jgi:hypothetical protein
MVLFISQLESYGYLMIVLQGTFQNSWSYLGWSKCEVVQWETHEGGKWWFFLMCMDLLKTIICCNFNFELVTKACTRQGNDVRNEVKVFLDSNTFPWKSVKEQAPTLQNEFSLWEFKMLGHFKFLDQGFGNKPCPNLALFRPSKRSWKLLQQIGLTFSKKRFVTIIKWQFEGFEIKLPKQL